MWTQPSMNEKRILFGFYVLVCIGENNTMIRRGAYQLLMNPTSMEGNISWICSSLEMTFFFSKDDPLAFQMLILLVELFILAGHIFGSVSKSFFADDDE